MTRKILNSEDIILSANQKKAYDILVANCEYSIRRGTICIVGDFLSGKTTLVKYFLSEMFGDIDKYYINVNKLLLERLKEEKTDFTIMSKIKAKTRLIMSVALEEVIEKHFIEEDILVLDAIEIIYPYNFDIISLVSKYTRDGKICIVCVPENDNFSFNFSWGNSYIIRLDHK